MRIVRSIVASAIILFGTGDGIIKAFDLEPATPGVADPHVQIEPGVCKVGNTIECKNDGKSVGMFSVAIRGSDVDLSRTYTSPTVNFGTTIALVNKNNPAKKLYIGYGSGNRQSQIFKGTGSVQCFMCTGSGAQSPNDREKPCVSPLDSNYCIDCGGYKIPVPCKDVLSLQTAHAKGSEDRAQDTTSLISRLGLAQSTPKPMSKKIEG